ncbi:MAG: exodeoxyribonuclease III [Vampirovibrionales bacterium]|nr:exodeoxyribonuclease III [Vampirovibrionales bacterium]
MKLYSWNVNGYRAAFKKGFADWLAQSGADIVGIQETKLQAEQLTPQLMAPCGYTSLFHHGVRKGYSGVALFFKPGLVPLEMGVGKSHLNSNHRRFDDEGRVSWAEFEQFLLFNVYFPNGNQSAERLQYKLDFYDAFLEHIEARRLQTGKPVIFCGDVNTAHRAIDLARPKENESVSGFLPIERAWLDKIAALGYVDTFRQRHPEASGQYSWWNMQTRARERNVGWRIDYFFVSPDGAHFVTDAAIHPEVMGSDHCPVSVTLAL